MYGDEIRIKFRTAARSVSRATRGSKSRAASFIIPDGGTGRRAGRKKRGSITYRASQMIRGNEERRGAVAGVGMLRAADSVSVSLPSRYQSRSSSELSFGISDGKRRNEIVAGYTVKNVRSLNY